MAHGTWKARLDAQRNADRRKAAHEGPARLTLVVAIILTAAIGCRRDERPGETQTTGGVVVLPATPPPFPTPPVLAGTPDVPALVAAVRPTVVNITTESEVARPRGVDPFEFFFGPRDRGGEDQVVKRRALGSGFIVDERGHVATNAHVVAGATAVRVKLSDGRELPATVRGSDARLDVAVLEIQGTNGAKVPFASLGSSEAVRVGEYVVAIGNPFGLGDTVTMGIVSAKGRELGAGPYDDFIQTDASINPGNSGGPLFDLRGQVIGINTAINPAGQGIGFAIPVDALREVLPQLLEKGRVERGRLGAIIQPVDSALAESLALTKPAGALISEVQRGSPAARAGLEPGDVILSVDGTTIDTAHELPRQIARRKPGTEVKLSVAGTKGQRTVTVVLDELKETGGPEQPETARPRVEKGGIGIAITDDPRAGVVVTGVDTGGPAAGHLDSGDVILEVDGSAVKSARDAAERIKKAPPDKPVLIRIRRDGRTRFVAIERKAK